MPVIEFEVKVPSIVSSATLERWIKRIKSLLRFVFDDVQIDCISVDKKENK